MGHAPSFLAAALIPAFAALAAAGGALGGRSVGTTAGLYHCNHTFQGIQK